MVLSSIIYHILYLIIYCAKTLVMVKEFVRGLFFHGVNWLPWHECGCHAQGEKGEIFDGANWLLCNREKGLGVCALSQSAGDAHTQKYERAA